MDRKKLNAIKDRMLELLEPIKEEYAVTIEYAGGNFSDTEFTAKINMRDEGAKSELAKQYEAMMKWNNWRELGETVTFRSGKKTVTAKILGYDYKKRKYPIIVQAPNGDKYKLPERYAEKGV